jgi:hypothetical protein
LEAIKKITIEILKSLLAFGILISLLVGFVMWKKYPIESYCNNLVIGTTFDTVIKLAHDAKLKTPFIENNKKDSLLVFNQESPYFRLACEAEFKDGKLTSARSLGAD